jgi:hypothetical protein
MPIFESDEEITPEELIRQQKLLNDKVFRLETKRMVDEVYESSCD